MLKSHEFTKLFCHQLIVINMAIRPITHGRFSNAAACGFCWMNSQQFSHELVKTIEKIWGY